MSGQSEPVSCSFCDERCLPSEIGEHLMLCGNKTDQCPNCEKYIRRAIFAYHYENNCANLDEFETNANTAAKQPQTFSTSQLIDPPSSLASSSARNEDNITFIKVEFPRTTQPQPSISQQSESDFYESRRIIAICKYCNQQCDTSDLIKHEEKCLQNPVNMKNKQSSSANATASSSTDQLYPIEKLHGTATIPCELCNEPIEWRHFEDHMKACYAREQERMQNQARPADEIDGNFYTPCKHCYEVPSILNVRIHEAVCSKNPRNVAWGAWLNEALKPPPLHTPYPIQYYPYGDHF